jgi:hypothetical protein
MTGTITQEQLSCPHVRFLADKVCPECGEPIGANAYMTGVDKTTEEVDLGGGIRGTYIKQTTSFRHVNCKTKPTLAQTLERFLTHLCRGK